MKLTTHQLKILIKDGAFDLCGKDSADEIIELLIAYKQAVSE